MQELRPYAQTPQRRRPDHIDGSLVEARHVDAEGPLNARVGTDPDPCDALAGHDVVRNLLELLHAASWSLGMLSLHDPIAAADIMQHEVTIGMDDLVPESLGHGAQVAAGLRPATGVE